MVIDYPAPGTVVLRAAALPPGASTNFVRSYLVPRDCSCCQVVNTNTARGWNRCASVQVADTTTIVTRYLTHPTVLVALECPPEGGVGQIVSVPGSVMNAGDVPLTNVTVLANGTRIVGPITLARGEMQDFTTSYTVGNSVQVVATASDSCNGAVVSDQHSCGSFILPPRISIGAVTSQSLTLSWTSQVGVTYRVQWSASLVGGTWTDEAGDVTATGTTCTKTVAIPPGTTARYYRVVAFR